MDKQSAPQDETLRWVYGLDAAAISEAAEHLTIGGGTRGGPVLHHGKGVRVWDLDGKDYIDCTSQSWALYLGYGHAELWSAINEHAQNLTHTHQGFDTLPRFALARRLSEVMPQGLDRASFVPSSALAVEGCMKLALKNRPGAAHFLSLWDGYHGTTLGTMGASWISTQSNGSYIGGSRFLPLTRQFVRAPNPYCYRCPFNQEQDSCDMMCARMLELTIQRGVNGPPAGLIIEPLQASAGQICFPGKYVTAVRDICTRYGIPLIFDEIQTFARIGKWTAAEYFDVTPDFIALGKAIGGGLPLGVTVIGKEMEAFSPDTEELHTFANNSLSQVGSLKLIDLIERDKVLDNANTMGSYLREGLTELQQRFPEMGDIRQVGMHIGVEFVSDPDSKEPLLKETRQIRDEGMRCGIILGLAGVRQNLLKIKPPLIISQDECGEVLEKFETAMTRTLRK